MFSSSAVAFAKQATQERPKQEQNCSLHCHKNHPPCCRQHQHQHHAGLRRRQQHQTCTSYGSNHSSKLNQFQWSPYGADETQHSSHASGCCCKLTLGSCSGVNCLSFCASEWLCALEASISSLMLLSTITVANSWPPEAASTPPPPPVSS